MLAIVILYLADGNLGLVFFNVLLIVMGFLSFLLTVILTFRTMPYAPLLYFVFHFFKSIFFFAPFFLSAVWYALDAYGRSELTFLFLSIVSISAGPFFS